MGCLKSRAHLLSIGTRLLAVALLATCALLGACGAEHSAGAQAPPEPSLSDAGAPSDAGADAEGSEVASKETPVALRAMVTGLLGHGLVLRTSAGEQVAVTSDGRVDFAGTVARLDATALTIVTQPVAPRQTCEALLQGSELRVRCVTERFAIGGSVTGLSGTGLVLGNAAGEMLAVSEAGAFTFGELANDLSSYAVSVRSQPTSPKQACVVARGMGTVAGADVRSIQVSCTTERFGFSGMVSGLLGQGLAIELAGEVLQIATDGPFAFASTLADGSAYAVEIKTQPREPVQRCSVVQSAATLAGADVRDLSIVCGALGGLRITEVGSCYFANSGCWFELYNAGSAPEQLSYYRLRSPAARRGWPFSTSALHDFALPQAVIAPGQRLVVQGASQGVLPDGLGVVHLVDAEQIPWWNDSGFLELTTASRTIDFVRFGESDDAPLSASEFVGPAVQGLPSGASSYGYAIARDLSSADSNRAADWRVTAFATPGGPNDVTSESDVDRDGVPDSAEISGGHFAGLDLYAMGARVGPRDVFVEIDHMDRDDAALLPRREALDKLVAVFATRNIAVHFDVGNLYAPSFDPAKHNLGGGNAVPFAPAIAIGAAGAGFADLYEYKAAHMAAARRLLFYYMLFAWSQNEDGSGGSSGIGERPGNDTIITLGGWGLSTSTAHMRNLVTNYQAATMMHELGHNLGLRHGGGDDLNRKPNYLSVMNYLYSPLGLPTIGKAEGDRYDLYRRCTLLSATQLSNSPTADPSKFVLDFSDGTSGDLHETSLDEREGLGRLRSESVDYNCNGRTDAPYARDLNGDDTKSVLVDHDDWQNLEFVFRRSYSGSQNGASLLLRRAVEVREDLLTDDVQHVSEEPCPAPVLPLQI